MRQKLGQHFLINPEVSRAIAAALEPSAGEAIIEVGPGHGELTQEIVSAIESGKPENIKLIAVEKDPLLAAGVRQQFQKYPNVEVIEADILKFLADPARQPLLRGTYKLVGNLPYYLTGHLLRIVGDLKQKPALSLFMVQKEVAERMSAKPPRMNRLAAAVQFWSEPQMLFNISRNDFDPPPEVDSSVVLLRPRSQNEERDAAAFYETIQALFAQPRKTIFNNLRKAFAARKLTTETAAKLLKGAGVDPKARPQNVSLEKIRELANKLTSA